MDDVRHAKRDMREARVLFGHVHQDVLAAGAINTVEDEVQLDSGRILDDRNGVEIGFVLELEPEGGIEGKSTCLVGDADTEVIELVDANHGRAHWRKWMVWYMTFSVDAYGWGATEPQMVSV